MAFTRSSFEKLPRPVRALLVEGTGWLKKEGPGEVSAFDPYANLPAEIEIIVERPLLVEEVALGLHGRLVSPLLGMAESYVIAISFQDATVPLDSFGLVALAVSPERGLFGKNPPHRSGRISVNDLVPIGFPHLKGFAMLGSGDPEYRRLGLRMKGEED